MSAQKCELLHNRQRIRTGFAVAPHPLDVVAYFVVAVIIALWCGQPRTRIGSHSGRPRVEFDYFRGRIRAAAVIRSADDPTTLEPYFEPKSSYRTLQNSGRQLWLRDGRALPCGGSDRIDRVVWVVLVLFEALHRWRFSAHNDVGVYRGMRRQNSGDC